MNIDYCDCPEDWPADPPELRQLDRSLRCGICQDVYTGPVVLLCGHSYCSRCIRDSMNVRLRDGQPQACPSCRLPCDQAELRPATHLREASQAWHAVRQLLLKSFICKQQPQVHDHQQQQQQQQAQQQEWQQVPRQSLHHTAGPVLRRQRNVPAAGVAGSEPQQQAEAITISSNGEAESDGEQGCSVASDAEVAAEDDGDSDWQYSDYSDESEQQPHSRRKVQPTAAGKRKLLNAQTSSSAGDDGAPFARQPDAQAASGDEFVVRECKRPRSSNDSDTGKQQQQLHDGKQPPRTAAKGMQAGSKPAHQQRRQGAQRSGTEQQQQQQQRLLPGYVACPVCGLSVKEAFINTHVDSCLSRASSAQPPAVTAAASTRQTSALPSTPYAAADADRTASRGSCLTRHSVPAAGQGGAAAHTPSTRKPLEPPPKLCFELMKDKVLKSKLTALRLSTEGDKKACEERYTSFRSFILALRDSGRAGISLADAAADFTRQERHKARAASRAQSLGARAGAAPSVSVGIHSNGARHVGAPHGAAGCVTGDVANSSKALDYSYAALIQETRARMALQKCRPQQQEQSTGQQEQQQEECRQERQHCDGEVLAEKGVLLSVQPDQPQNSGRLAEDAAELAAAAVTGVERQASHTQLGSQGIHIAAAEKPAVAMQREVAMAAVNHVITTEFCEDVV